MKNSIIFKIGIVFLMSIFLSCEDNEIKKPEQTSIDVNTIWRFDDNGVKMNQVNDIQWQKSTLSAKELALFDNLSSVSLDNTLAPDSILESFDIPSSIIPNPFQGSFILGFRLNTSYSGEFVCKSVIVDSMFNIKESFSHRFNDKNNFISRQTSLIEGYYRMYIVLSAQNKLDFYQSWGNIKIE